MKSVSGKKTRFLVLKDNISFAIRFFYVIGNKVFIDGDSVMMLVYLTNA